MERSETPSTTELEAIGMDDNIWRYGEELVLIEREVKDLRIVELGIKPLLSKLCKVAAQF